MVLQIKIKEHFICIVLIAANMHNKHQFNRKVMPFYAVAVLTRHMDQMAGISSLAKNLQCVRRVALFLAG